MIQSNKEGVRNYNQVYLHEGKEETIIYIPAYLRILTKSVKSLDIQSLHSQLTLTIILNIFTYGLPEDFQEYIASNAWLDFVRDNNVQLDKGQPHKIPYKLFQDQINKTFQFQKKEKQEKKQQQKTEEEKKKEQQKRKQLQKKKVKIGYKWTQRLTRKAFVQPYIFFTPFQIVDQILTIHLRDITYKRKSKIAQKKQQIQKTENQQPAQQQQEPQQPQQTFIIKFNLMDYQMDQKNEQTKIQKKMDFTDNTQFGYYKLATRRFAAQYTKQSIHTTLMKLGKNFYNIKFLDNYREEVDQTQQQQKIDKKKIQSVSYAHFHMPLYKQPSTALTTLFAPLWLLSGINLAIFSQNPSLGDRIGSILTLMIAFVGLIPITRQQIPPNPFLTFFQFLVYTQVLTQLICLWQSFTQLYREQDEFMDNYSHFEPYFLASLFLSTLIFLIPFGMNIYHFTTLQYTHFRNRDKKITNDKQFSKWNKLGKNNYIANEFDKMKDLTFSNEKRFQQMLFK